MKLIVGGILFVIFIYLNLSIGWNMCREWVLRKLGEIIQECMTGLKVSGPSDEKTVHFYRGAYWVMYRLGEKMNVPMPDDIKLEGP